MSGRTPGSVVVGTVRGSCGPCVAIGNTCHASRPRLALHDHQHEHEGAHVHVHVHEGHGACPGLLRAAVSAAALMSWATGDGYARDTEETLKNTRFPFPHQRLDAYHAARELLGQVHAITGRIPRGHRSLADQLQRAATSVALNLGEGANRLTSGEKRACFSRARGEAGEVAVAIDIAHMLRMVPEDEAAKAMALAGRVAAMLTGLIQRHR